MASASPSLDVGEEVTCPICMEYLTDPVHVECGHNFCRGCITQYCEKWEELGDLKCPLCTARIKKGDFRPNWSLANIVEKIKCLSLQLGKKDFCMRHQEKLNLFCREDQELVCESCEQSPEHQSHTVLLSEEAAREFRDELCSCLEVLKMVRERILADEDETEKESQYLLSKVKAERTKTEALFHQLHQFLEEKRSHYMWQMEVLEKDIAIQRMEHMARLMEELSSLEGLIQQMEEKCQQPAQELLQDIGRTLQRYEEKEAFQNPVAFPSELTCRIKEFHDINLLLEGIMKQFPAKVTLDPDTAHPQLILSEDRKSVRWGEEKQKLPNNPERFDLGFFVLGREEFSAGTHFWEIAVGREPKWAVGVAKKSLRRKNWCEYYEEKWLWAVGLLGGEYRAVSSPELPVLSLSQALKRIRVTLYCDEWRVTFSDADTGDDIYTYYFSGGTLLPFFYVCEKAHLRLSP